MHASHCRRAFTCPSSGAAVHASTESLAQGKADGYETYMDASDYEKMGTVVEAVTRTDAISDPRNVGDMVGALIAGGRAAHAIGSSVTLFEAGGNVLLSEGTKTLLRTAAERGAENALGYAANRVLGPAAMAKMAKMAKMPNLLAAAADVASATGPFAVRAAVKELLKGAGGAGGFGFVIDGTIASLEAVVAIRDRGVDRKSAVKHVAKEAVIQGQVLRAGDEPVANAYVRLLDRSGEFTAEVPTSATGHFRFFAGDGEWTLRTLAPKAQPVDTRVVAATGSVAEVQVLVGT